MTVLILSIMITIPSNERDTFLSINELVIPDYIVQVIVTTRTDNTLLLEN